MFVTNWISTTKIQKISEITNFFRHYFLSRTEVGYTEDDCRRISKPYKELKVFMKEKSAVYHAAIRLGIKDEICEHMKKNIMELTNS